MASRSTFCYKNTNSLKLTQAEINIKKENWNIFETVENTNSAIWKKIIEQGGFIGGYSNSTNTPVFYTFKNNEERIKYLAGQADHIREYPDVSGFLLPYSQRHYDVLYTNISSVNQINCVCPNIDTSKKTSAERALLNTKELSLYSQVSTFNATYPKSPYKFQSNADYLTYNKIKKFINSTSN